MARWTNPPAEISDTHVANLACQNPAAPLVHDARARASSLLLPSKPIMIRDPRDLDSAPDSRPRRAPNRQSRSCKVCRLRKVKVCCAYCIRVCVCACVLRSPGSGRDGPFRTAPSSVHVPRFSVCMSEVNLDL